MISPLAYIDPEAKIGQNVEIAPFVFIDKNVVIGDNNKIMAGASILYGTAHPRHAAHIFGNGNRRRAERMNQRIGKRQIYNRIAIYALVEELFATIEIDIAVMMIYHRGYAVETVTVEMELVQPILDIR